MSIVKLKNLSCNIYVSGFMASGKSTAGKLIAEKLEVPFIDLDQVIEEREKKSIVEIFEHEGESYFREKELEYLLDLSSSYHGVISLGGGALQNQEVVNQLKSDGLLVFLDTPIGEIVDRVYRKKHRPILYDENGEIKTKEALFDELKTLYSARLKFYKQAQVSINTSAYNSVNQLAEAAIDKINEHV